MQKGELYSESGKLEREDGRQALEHHSEVISEGKIKAVLASAEAADKFGPQQMADRHNLPVMPGHWDRAMLPAVWKQEKQLI